MELGAFSVSLSVGDLAASRAFYEKLGFVVVFGAESENWLILRNGGTTIGLFQGMFSENILTFNPGWDSDAGELDEYTDIREIQAQLKTLGVKFLTEVSEDQASGPASFMVVDPDGNQILVDQHAGGATP